MGPVSIHRRVGSVERTSTTVKQPILQGLSKKSVFLSSQPLMTPCLHTISLQNLLLTRLGVQQTLQLVCLQKINFFMCSIGFKCAIKT